MQSSTDLRQWTDVPHGRFVGGATMTEVGWTNAAPAATRTFFRVIRLAQQIALLQPAAGG